MAPQYIFLSSFLQGNKNALYSFVEFITVGIGGNVIGQSRTYYEWLWSLKIKNKYSDSVICPRLWELPEKLEPGTPVPVQLCNYRVCIQGWGAGSYFPYLPWMLGLPHILCIISELRLLTMHLLKSIDHDKVFAKWSPVQLACGTCCFCLQGVTSDLSCKDFLTSAVLTN